MSKCVPGRPKPFRNSCRKSWMMGLDGGWCCLVLSSEKVQEELYVALMQHPFCKYIWTTVWRPGQNVIPDRIIFLVCQISCRCNGKAVLFNTLLIFCTSGSKWMKKIRSAGPQHVGGKPESWVDIKWQQNWSATKAPTMHLCRLLIVVLQSPGWASESAVFP